MIRIPYGFEVNRHSTGSNLRDDVASCQSKQNENTEQQYPGCQNASGGAKEAACEPSRAARVRLHDG
jgi:hypothetical protein